MHPYKARLNYKSFEAAVTSRFNIIVENWPLEGQMRSPAEIGGRLELETLLHAWESGVTRFTKLTDQQMLERDERLRAQSVSAPSDHPPPALPEGDAQTLSGVPPVAPPSPSPSTPASPIPTDTSAVPAPTPMSASIASFPAHAVEPVNRAGKRPAFSVFINQDGPPTQKKRKTRSDKDTTRGPNVRTRGRGNGAGKGKGKDPNTTVAVNVTPPAVNNSADSPPSNSAATPSSSAPAAQ